MTDRAVIARAERWIRLTDVAVHTPTHVERVSLVGLFHRLDLSVTSLARDAGVDVPHMREVYVLRQLVDADPRHRLFLVGETDELLDLSFVVVGRTLHDSVAAHAGAHRG